MDQLGKKDGTKVQKSCPGCGMIQAEWPDAGVVVNGTEYCCRGCAHGLGCTCRTLRPKNKAATKTED